MGCSKNLVDSEKLMAQLQDYNFSLSHDVSENADFVVVNTCGFIKDAKEESIEVILNLLEEKKDGNIEKVFVMGCLSERYMDDLKEELPELDGIYGVTNLMDVLKDIGVDYKKELLGERYLTTPKHYAYLKVSEGCDRSCAFCAIPLIRGKHISIPIEDLIKEAISLRNKGVKELLLIAQDLTYYGVDIYGKKMLAELVRKLSDIEGIEWIRFHYAYPTQFPDDVLKLMRERSNICNYIDIPLQHISDDILSSMRRGHNGYTTRKLIKKFRSYVPDINIRTTLIVGFPGETEEHFLELMEFVRESRFDRLGAFTYSAEEDTPAYSLGDDVPQEVKIDRLNRLMELQEQISLEKNEERIGKTLKVVVDKEEDTYYIARSEYDSPEVDNEVIIDKSEGELEIGKFYNVKVIAAESFDIEAELV